MTIGVVVADDQAIVRAGFRMLIDAEPDLAVLGEAADGAEAVAVTRQTAPDVVLMDIRMPVLDGIEATRQITAAGPLPRVLILTTFDLDDYVFGALRAGGEPGSTSRNARLRNCWPRCGSSRRARRCWRRT